MKLASLLVVLMLGGVAHAEDPFAAQPRQRGQLRQMLLQKFDRNGDGRLGPHERRQAARVLRRLADRMERPQMRQQRQQRHQRQHKFIDRFDHDRDGNVGPGEMPPGLADELRPLDRDGDGWLEGNELP